MRKKRNAIRYPIRRCTRRGVLQKYRRNEISMRVALAIFLILTIFPFYCNLRGLDSIQIRPLRYRSVNHEKNLDRNRKRSLTRKIGKSPHFEDNRTGNQSFLCISYGNFQLPNGVPKLSDNYSGPTRGLTG